MEFAEGVSYSVLAIGSVLDQVSTHIALTCPQIYEVNPFIRWLQDHDLWIPFDISVLLLLTLPLSITIQEKKSMCRRVLTLIPLIVGMVRLIVAVWNLNLLG